MAEEAAIERAERRPLATPQPCCAGGLGDPGHPAAGGFVAELTHRGLPGRTGASDRPATDSRKDELDAVTWSRVFVEAATLGAGHVRLLGGEPRRDLVDIVAHAREAGLTTCLAIAGIGVATRTMRDLWEAGLSEVEVSIFDADAVSADRMAAQRGAFQRKHALAAEAVRLGLPLTVSFVAGRDNIGRLAAMVALALRLKARRVAIMDVEHSDWVLAPDAASMPAPDQVLRATAGIEELRRVHQDRIVIEAQIEARDTDDRERRAPGWGQGTFHVAPSGLVWPRRAVPAVLGAELWNVSDHSLAHILASSPAFRAAGVPFTGAFDVG
jgi:pyrroloquinoline quinone biosynthesis protein E